MRTSRLRRGIALGALVVTPIATLTASCARDPLPAKGQLMLVVTSNMAPPKDFDSFQLTVVEEGTSTPIHDVTYALAGSQAVKLPATLGVVAGADPNKVVRVIVEARRSGAVRVKREALTRVPQNRIAALPLPIDGLCVESTCPPAANGSAQTCIAGTCQSAIVEVESLPSYSVEGVFGGGTGSGDGACFDTLGCFSTGTVVPIEASDCSIDKQAGGLNVAVLRPPNTDGICGTNACLLPLDRDPFVGPVVTGWRESGTRVLVPRAVCERSYAVMTTTSCPTKSAPTCGPWSAVGSGSGLVADAALPVGDASFGDASGPLPTSIDFVDEDPQQAKVAGTVTIGRAGDESTVTGYALYWGDGPSKKLDLITTLPKTGKDLTYSLAGDVRPGATHLIAFSTNSAGENAPGVAIGPIDNYPTYSSIAINNPRFWRPITLVDPSTESLLVVGSDYEDSRNLPALIRCKLDQSGCTYADLSAGVPTAGQWALGATIDTAAQKLLVSSDRVGGVPILFRCALDGTGCTSTELGSPAPALAQNTTECELPLLIDSGNNKLLALFRDFNDQTTLLRCQTDGTACTSANLTGASNGGCPSAVISPTDAKLLVVRPSGPSLTPYLFRCSLDGSSCSGMDISAGNTTAITLSMSTAIDAENKKLITVGSDAGLGGLHLYRCNLDGTGCETHKLTEGFLDLTQAVSASLVIDPVRRHLFVFSFTFTSNRGFFLRCNLDGTSCTSTFSAPFATGAGKLPSALLYKGRLFAVGTTTGAALDLTSIAAW